MEFNIPEPLKIEHEELHAELARMTKQQDEIGRAAQEVAKILHPHFVKEEEYALPPLGLLTRLSKGKVTPDLKAVLTMTRKLKAELPQMLAEHTAIVAALKRLAAAAQKQKKTKVMKFTEKLILHARTEEELLYPAAILIGEYLKLKLKGAP